jgi:hypothetical protein
MSKTLELKKSSKKENHPLRRKLTIALILFPCFLCIGSTCFTMWNFLYKDMQEWVEKGMSAPIDFITLINAECEVMDK